MIPQHTPSAKARRLKVGYSYPYAGASEEPSPSLPMPYLRLRGRWLKDAGFAIGRNVKVEVNEGRLTIEPVD
jgi:toxic protein SymE